MRSHSKHIVLDRIRVTLNLLRKSNVGYHTNHIEEFMAVQQRLRFSQRDAVDPCELLAPFLSIIRSPYLSGPFKLSALDSVQTFLNFEIMAECTINTGEALDALVEAVTKCKFVQTDATGDELVQLHIVQTLNQVVKSSIRIYLKDDTTWTIVQACYSLLLQSGTLPQSPTLLAGTERTLLDTIRFVFANCSPSPEEAYMAALNSRGDGEAELEVTDNDPIEEACGDQIRSRSSTRNIDVPLLGHSCAKRLLRFFIGVLQKHGADGNAPQRPKSRRASLSTSRSSVFNESALDVETHELLLCLKALHAMLVPEDANMDSSRTLIISSPEISALVRDDLGKCLIVLCGKRHFAPSVMQGVLSVFGTLVVLLGPAMRVTMECFFRYVYLKALYQLQTYFLKQEEVLTSLGSGASDPVTASNALIALAATQSDGFSGDELEIVLESLSDFISEGGFLPSLFASCDCDPCAPDIVQPLVKFLSQCARSALILESFRLPPSQETDLIGLAIHCFHQMAQTFSDRCEDSISREMNNAEAGSSTSVEHADAKTGKLGGPKDGDVKKLSKSLCSLRQSKLLLAESAKIFVEKPEKGFKFLQEKGALPTPLTPSHVARYLRVAQDLPNEAVGAYLGELGKDNASYNANGKDFHVQVLNCYVRSFELSGQDVMSCMRIFLSAFRLPGEAQQIDRILVSFSEYLHANCIEGRSGVLENAEVTYLLTFSIIMLTTDLHNPNIKKERKMTLEQFIRNNINYGRDCNQTRPLPREFLVSVYDSIATCPIRTEENNIFSDITPEMWMEMQLKAGMDPSRCAMVSCSHEPRVIKDICNSYMVPKTRIPEEEEGINMEAYRAKGEGDTPASVTLDLLTSTKTRDTFQLSMALFGSHWFLDHDLVSLIWCDLLGVGMIPFVMHRKVPPAVFETTSPQLSRSSTPTTPKLAVPKIDLDNLPERRPTARTLQIGADVLVLVVKMGNIYCVDNVKEIIALLLADFSGLMKVSIVESVIDALKLEFEVLPDLVLSREPAETRGLSSPRKRKQTITIGNARVKNTDVFLETIVSSANARVALLTLLKLAHNHPAYIGETGWTLVWHALGLLRDCLMLPRAMVIESDMDLLPAFTREEFEGRLAEEESKAKALAATRPMLPEKKQSSLLSLQGIGEALFGGNDMDSDEANMHATLSDPSFAKRWDAGYEFDFEAPTSEYSQPNGGQAAGGVKKSPSNVSLDVPQSPIAAYDANQSLSNDYRIPEIVFYSLNPEILATESGITIIEEAFRSLRRMILDCDLARLISDARFLDENTLQCFITSLIRVAENGESHGRGCGRSRSKSYDGPTDIIGDTYVHVGVDVESGPNANSAPIPVSGASTRNSSPRRSASGEGAALTELSGIVARGVNSVPPASASSCAWLEMVLPDCTIRNRDRFGIVWPAVAAHYYRTLTAGHTLSYVVERRVVGIFKIATRIMSRESVAGPLLGLLGRLLVPPQQREFSARLTSGVPALSPKLFNIGPTSSSDTFDADDDMHLNLNLIEELSGQISACIWRLLTLNVAALPSLSLEDWQILFDIIATSGAAGGYASIKAFETMAWLLHEPRLRAEVPVFCIVGLRPLLCNVNAPASVSIGTVQLLVLFHTRLEVLIKEDEFAEVPQDFDEDGEGDTPSLWESCWTPILRLLADGAGDPRKEVSIACVQALARTLTDKHVSVVPAGLLVDVLSNIVASAVLVLGERLADEVRSSRERMPSHEIRRKMSMGSDKSKGSDGQLQKLADDVDRMVPNSPVSPSDMPGSPRKNKVPGSAARVGPAAECICCLCDCLLQELPKLALYPSFDKLWLSFLHAFGYYLGAAHGFDRSLLPDAGMSAGAISSITELVSAAKVAEEELVAVLRALRRARVFTHREGLWDVTKETIASYQIDSSFLNDERII